MDLGISGKKGIVGGASSGLGRACALALAREGVELVIVARTEANIKAAAEEISSATGTKVIPVAADINSDEGRAAGRRRGAQPLRTAGQPADGGGGR